MLRRVFLTAFAAVNFTSAPLLAQAIAPSAPLPLQRVIVSVAGTNDEWTPTGLTVHLGDLVVIRADGRVRVGQYLGEVDALGNNGAGLLQIKFGVGAGRPAGKAALHVVESSGEIKLRVADSRYEDNSGEFKVDVLVIPSSAIPAVPAPGGAD